MQQPIVGFYKDEKGDWVAELACNHNLHVRHNPPWTMREWVLNEAARASKLDTMLDCKKCDRAEPADRAEPIEP